MSFFTDSNCTVPPAITAAAREWGDQEGSVERGDQSVPWRQASWNISGDCSTSLEPGEDPPPSLRTHI